MSNTSPTSLLLNVGHGLDHLFLLIFATFFKNADIQGLGVNGATYYVPAIVALAVISATMVKLAMNLSSEREGGMLKRVRGTQKAFAEFRSLFEAGSRDVPTLHVGLAHAAAPERLQ